MRVDQNRRIIHPRLMILASFLLFPFADANAQPAGPVQNGLNTGFDPSTAIVVVIVVVAFFFIGMVSIFLRQCSEPAGGGNYLSYAGAARYIRSRLPHGLDKSVIESFPVLARSAIGGELECAVCLCEFEDDQSFRLLPKCRHVFHPVCIDTWLASHVTCPVCRANLEHGSSGSGDPTPEFNIPVGDFERLRPVTITGGISRSHSTGHSLAAVGADRYTLRISEEQMTEVIDRARLERAASFNTGGGHFPREWNSWKGYKGNFNEEDGPGLGERWVVFWMTPPFVSRGPDAVIWSKPVDGNGDGGGSGNVRDTKITARPLV